MRFASLTFIVFFLCNCAAHAEVVMTTVNVPMRDGIQLSTDIYRDSAVDRAPVVLMRTPYNKQRAKVAAEKFAGVGYIAVVQDCRGKFASQGDFIPYNNEGQDGYDCIEWIGKQDWCNGRIGMWGSSYVGATQWQAAVESPPGLVTITPTATWSSFYRNLYLGGACRHTLIATWAGGNSPKPEGAVVTGDWPRTLMHLPLSEIDDQIGWPIPWLEGMLTHPSAGGYWKRLDLTDDMLKLKLPMQHVVGYYDFFSRESVNNFVRMQTMARDPSVGTEQQLILGPWDHGTIGASRVGELDFGPEAKWDAHESTRQWFDRYLKEDSAAQAMPFSPVRYFVIGENKWRDTTAWPPPESKEVSYYFHSDGRAAGRLGTGKLDRNKPTESEPRDVFWSDPNNPTPACPVTPERPLQAAVWAPVDQRSIEERTDILCYTTEPLAEPLTIAGNVSAELMASTSTTDADWVVKLVDVHENEAAYNLAVGIIRGRFRDSETEPKPMVPDAHYRLTIDLGPIAAKLPKGHRLRVDVCGAYFPLFDRNPNTGEGPFGSRTAVARQYVFHNDVIASRIILPVVP